MTYYDAPAWNRRREAARLSNHPAADLRLCAAACLARHSGHMPLAAACPACADHHRMDEARFAGMASAGQGGRQD